ncbi:Uma2 family endonuclease [Amycolatopsis rhabdoformis]|uniref:Uma2 family endonuclease n=1 Tax=Amycolatopsis rhabdoformis TaxID=1448059 RepID=A0ABZ1IPZ4_9PSEU|nr:Uma2 family endonuclease [Amycolatopsis rhabdoformis]WSE35275.1 Uma2 family endonuclease [Amycolatopsis rhabdoformis]
MPLRLLTIEAYLALGETEPGYTELSEGRLVLSPTPSIRHNRAVYQLATQLMEQLPHGLEAVPGVDVDLRLALPDEPGFSRRPDLVVIDSAAVSSDEVIRASEVLIAVEIVSPGSKRTDYVTKHDEYADAGIPFYWIVDLSDPVSLVACHQAGELGYQDAPAVTGVFTTTQPFAAKVDLTALTA